MLYKVEAAAAPKEEEVFWSVSQMMLRASATTPQQHNNDNINKELSNRVSVRVPRSSLTGNANK